MTFELVVEAEPSAPRIVRKEFSRAFPRLTCLEDACLCLSEAVTNSVLHGVGPILVRALDGAGVVRVEVHDESATPPVRRTVDERSTTGRGVHLLDRLCTRWGVDLDGHGKTVWLEFDTGGLR
jgi:hypothetical protein